MNSLAASVDPLSPEGSAVSGVPMHAGHRPELGTLSFQREALHWPGCSKALLLARPPPSWLMHPQRESPAPSSAGPSLSTSLSFMLAGLSLDVPSERAAAASQPESASSPSTQELPLWEAVCPHHTLRPLQPLQRDA
ncbi:unnamed protein product [Rangifer tarandus platyrhynchus]|uniref:Uncharacterized protein n=1 Tax=Rangifer tarandus platyrhynchus TaxID=3082113 RepID=A0AC60A5Z4_RANTA